MDTTQKTPNREVAENSHKSLIGEVEACSTWELEAEIAQSSADLTAARILEAAARRRHQKEKRPETEAAYEGRRAEAERLRHRRERLLEEFDRRELDRRDGSRPR